MNNQEGFPEYRLIDLIITLGQAIQLPICVGLTLKVAMKKKKKTAPVIPKHPMFHDDPNIEDSSENDQNEIELGSMPQNDNNMEQLGQGYQMDAEHGEGSSGLARIIHVKPCDDQMSHHHM